MDSKQAKIVKRFQKKLFKEILFYYGNIRQLSIKHNIPYTTLYKYVKLQEFIAPHLVVDLCLLAGNGILPHQLRPDIFKPALAKIYGGRNEQDPYV